MAVDIVVVAACVAWMVCDASVGVVGRYAPHECGHADIDAEAQVLGSVVHATGAVEPYALQVEGHVNLVARVGVVAIDPDFVVRGVYALHPDFVDQDVGLDLVVVTAVNHDFFLRVEVAHGACSLAVGEVMDGPGRSSQCHQDHNCNDCNAFHKA